MSRRISSLNKMIPDQGGGRDFVRRVTVDERLLIRGAEAPRRPRLNAAAHWSRHAAVIFTYTFTVPFPRPLRVVVASHQAPASTFAPPLVSDVAGAMRFCRGTSEA